MSGSDLLRWTADSAEWLAPVFLLIAAASLVFARFIPHVLAWAGFVLSVVAITVLAPVRQGAALPEVIQATAWSCALLSLAFTICAAGVAWWQRRRRGQKEHHRDAIGTAYTAALLLGAVAFTIQSVVLIIRVVYAAIDLVNVYPWGGAHDSGYGPDGLWTVGFLFASCVVAFVSTRERQLFICQLWITVMIAVWACLLLPVYHVGPSGVLRSTGAMLATAASLSVLLTAAVIISGWLDRWERRRITRVHVETPAEPVVWPGLHSSCGVIAIAVILLVCHYLAVPIRLEGGGLRIAAVVAAGSSAMAACGAFLLVSRQWSGNLADAALGLTSLGICGLAVSVVPPEPDALAERYPMIFNAMLVGLALGAGLCTALATFWDRARHDGTAPTMRFRLVPHARRFAFLNAAAALVLAGMMALWPRLRSIGTPDFSLGRVTAGFGGNLFLLLVMLWCSRRLKRITFNVLTILAVASTAGFMVVRMLPYMARFD